MPVPNTFGTATSAIPLSQLDDNFAAPITIGNTAVQLGNTVTTLNNMTLANVTISSGTITITNVSVTTANVSGTANISTLVVVGNATVGGNTTITGNITAANANVTSNLVLSGGTANGVAYLNTSKQVTTGSALVFDGTNLSVGTGKVSTSTAGTSAGFQWGGTTVTSRLYDDGIGNVYLDVGATGSNANVPLIIRTKGTANVAFNTGGSQTMTLDASGRLLVGTTSGSGATMFTVNQPVASTDAKTIVSTTTGTNAAFTAFVNTTVTTVGTENSSGGSLVSGSSAYSTVIANNGAYPISFGTNNTERARIDSSGNLGLGAAPSASWLTSFSNRVMQFGPVGSINSLSASTTNNQTFFSSNVIDQGGGAYSRIYADWITRYTQNSGKHVWQTSTTQTGVVSMSDLMTLDSSGNLLVGTTTDSGKIYSKNANNTDTIVAHSTSATYGQTLVNCLATRNTTDGTFLAIAYYNLGAAAYKFVVSDSGNVTNTNNSYGQISDIKLKENIVDATPKLEKLNQVRVVNFNFIGDQQKQLGVVAQELEQVFPGMIDESPDRDAKGNDLGTTTKAVKYSVFVPMLIKAIQEQQALITQLTARITALEGA